MQVAACLKPDDTPKQQQQTTSNTSALSPVATGAITVSSRMLLLLLTLCPWQCPARSCMRKADSAAQAPLASPSPVRALLLLQASTQPAGTYA